MLNEIQQDDMTASVRELLVTANLIEEKDDSCCITVDGFRFILEDINTQVHILLLNYIKLKQQNPQVLKLIFQLTLSTENSYTIISF